MSSWFGSKKPDPKEQVHTGSIGQSLDFTLEFTDIFVVQVKQWRLTMKKEVRRLDQQVRLLLKIGSHGLAYEQGFSRDHPCHDEHMCVHVTHTMNLFGSMVSAWAGFEG